MLHDLHLSQPALKHLAAWGLLLGGLAHSRRLAAGSRIEGPTAIQSVVAPGAMIDIGAFSNLSGGQINNLRAGRYCSIADGVSIGTHEHPTDWLTTSRTAYFPQVHQWHELMLGDGASVLGGRVGTLSGSCPVTTLGPDVWIGQGAFLKSGVTIGPGAIVGARATVLKDVPPYAIVVGTPARVLRMRFPEPMVERLLTSAWWQYSVYDLFDAPLNNPEQALDIIEEKRAQGRLRPFVAPVFTPEDLGVEQVVAARIRQAIQHHSGEGAAAAERIEP